jgi:CHAD domain-containing protein
MAWARELGAIVGELRDADVIIDELIAPHLVGHHTPSLLSALQAWRNEVRGRVRARLTAVKAAEFPRSLGVDAANRALLKSGAKGQSAAQVVQPFLAMAWERTVCGWSVDKLSFDRVHDLRKDTKAARYATELMGTVSGKRRPGISSSLKRLQDLLGCVNDWAALAQFDPPIGAHREVLAAARARIVAEQRKMMDQTVANAANEWRELWSQISR